jgi:hypothetical protein
MQPLLLFVQPLLPFVRYCTLWIHSIFEFLRICTYKIFNLQPLLPEILGLVIFSTSYIGNTFVHKIFEIILGLKQIHLPGF